MVNDILDKDASLEGVDLSSVYTFIDNTPDHYASFKKNEDVQKMAKSILKHRIRTLTGRDISVIEKEMKYKSEDGMGLSVDVLRRLAHYLILKANGALDSELPSKSVSPIKKMEKRKTRNSLLIPSSIRDSPRSRRRSELLHLNAPLHSSFVKRKTGIEKSEDSFRESEILETKKRFLESSSSSVITANNNNAAAASLCLREDKKKTKSEKDPKIGFSGALDFGGHRNQIYFAQESSLLRPSISKILKKAQIPYFKGSQLSLIYPGENWMSPEIYFAIDSIVKMNHSFKLTHYLLLIKCSIENAPSTKASLVQRFTEHVQMIVTNRSCLSNSFDENEDFGVEETTSLYLLAYFFPCCKSSEGKPERQMVRPGISSCLTGKSDEDVENVIVNAFTEIGDWIIEVNGASENSEISLAAQKLGRYALVIDSNESALESLQEKAIQIATFHDKGFRDIDGDIIIIENEENE